MEKEVTMPKLGESVTEGTISKWLVKPGDQVKKYDPIAEVMTDKVNAEIPSSYTGMINELRVKEDQPVEVGAVICTMDVQSTTEPAAEPPSRDQSSELNDDREQASDQSRKRRYSPAVLRLSQEHGIDLEQVSGSGKGGRITRKDIQQAIDSGSVPEPKQTSDRPAMKQTAQPTQTVDIEKSITGVRKVIADNMVRSKHEAPHAWMTIEVDVTNLARYRNHIKDDFKRKEGYSLTFLPFFIKATVEALREFPQLNSIWQGDKLIQKKDINISLAVAKEEALYVPVIKNADDKSIKGLAKDVNVLASKVRAGNISGDEMQDGTFTVNNTGSFGSILSTPIINQPQVAILSVESIVKRPVVIESPQGDMIAIRSMVNLCLSLDHRVLDGLVCGRFLARIKEKLENMSQETLSI